MDCGAGISQTNCKTGTVYCVIPVFNRIEKTLNCLACLERQTFQNLVTLVCDGGSTDGTPGILAERYPDVIVLQEDNELWWGGATRLGVDWALAQSASSDDRILLLNNDVIFESHYISRILAHCNRHNAAICGVVVHSECHTRIVDAGVTLDWDNYEFKGSYEIPQDGSQLSLASDVLPGRGTIIPIDAVRAAGTINDQMFPHYLSDYEFTYRLRRRGNIRLGVAFDAKTETSPDGIAPAIMRNPFSEVSWRYSETRSIRSKRNMITHLHMIREHAPADIKTRLLFRQRLRWFMFVIRPPLDVTWHQLPHPVRRAVRLILRAITHPRAVIRKIFGV